MAEMIEPLIHMNSTEKPYESRVESQRKGLHYSWDSVIHGILLELTEVIFHLQLPGESLAFRFNTHAVFSGI